MSAAEFLKARWDLWGHLGELHDNGFSEDHVRGWWKALSEFAGSVNGYLDNGTTPDRWVVQRELAMLLALLDRTKGIGPDFIEERAQLQRAYRRLTAADSLN